MDDQTKQPDVFSNTVKAKSKSPASYQLRNGIDAPQIDGQVELQANTVLAGGAGIAAKRPVKGLFIGYQYFATDTFVLSLWTGSAYKSVTLT